MDSVNYFDRRQAVKASISFGQFVVSVNIDGLPSTNFYQMGVSDVGIENDLTALLRRHSTDSIITLLGMRDSDAWQIELNDDQTLSRMEEIFREAGLPGCVEAIRTGRTARNPDLTLTKFWKQELSPRICEAARLSGEDQHSVFSASLLKAHPANSRRKLHPKAESFLQQDLPEHIQKHLKAVDRMIVKSA